MTSAAYGIAFPASRGILIPAKYCAAAEAFFARLSTQPSAARKLLYDSSIRSLVAAGVWSKLDALYVLAAADPATALTNLVQAAYGATAVNSPTFTADQGYTGASTKYLSTGFNPSTASGANYLQNSASVFAWSLTSTGIDGATIGSVSNVSAKAFEIIPRWTDGVWYGGINSTAEKSIAGSQTDGSGLRTLSRTSSANFIPYKAATAGSTQTDTSVALTNDTIAILRNFGASAYTGTVAVAGFGGGLTAQNVADLYAALHAFLQAVAGVP